MDKLAWLYPELEGKELETTDGKVFRIVELVNVPRARLQNEKGEQRLMTRQDVVRGVVRLLKRDCSNALSLEMKKFIFRFVQRQEEMKSHIEGLRKKVRKAKSQARATQEKIKIHLAREAPKGEALANCQDTYTLPTLKDKAVKAERRMEVVQEELAQAEEDQDLKTHADIVHFFKTEFDVSVGQRTLRRWATNGEVGGKKGRTPAFSEDAERKLLQVVMWMDRVGFPMSRNRIRALANDLAEDLAIHARFSEEGPTEKWYAGWLKRAKQWEPNLLTVTKRGASCAMQQWFSSENVNYWFDTIKPELVRLGFAREPIAGEEGELSWLNPERVIVTGATCVSGGQTRKVACSSLKVLTTSERVELEGRGTKYRRVADPDSITEEHITVLAGHNLTGFMTVPVWIFSAANDIEEFSKKEIQAVAPKFPDYVAANNQPVTDVVFGTWRKGEVTKENFTDLIMRAIKLMYPDVAPVQGKRVCWFTDWHESRLSINLLTTLRENGIHVFGRLPSTSSKSQSPDVALFGSFKASRDAFEDAWISKNPGKRVNRTAKVEIAGRALTEVFTTRRIMDDCKRMGMLPFSRSPLLNHPCINDGDSVRHSHASEEANETFMTLRPTPISSARCWTTSASPAPFEVGAITPPSSPKVALDLQTPDSIESAESTFTSISQRKPRLGKYRTLCNRLDSEESFEELKQTLLCALKKKLKTCDAGQKIYIQKAKEQVKEQKYALAKFKARAKVLMETLMQIVAHREADIDMWLSSIIAKHKVEKEYLMFWETKIEESGMDDDMICRLAEKLDVLNEAQRDDLGLADECWLSKPPELRDVSLEPLEELMDEVMRQLHE